MKIVFFEIEDWEIPILKKGLGGNSLFFYKEKLDSSNINNAKNADIISIFVYSEINKKILWKLKKLKLISTRSTGFDHIDIKECRKKKITVYNVPSYGENTVAEHAFALILSLSRKIYLSQLKRAMNNYSIEDLKGFDLKGKTIGVIGVGHIGKHVIRIARGFDMDVLAFVRHPNKPLENELGFKHVSLNELLKKSDIVTIHVPYSKENRHMLGKKEFDIIKKGAIFINTARGELVDTEALIKALEAKRIAGVGIDVLEGEELIKDEKQFIYDPRKHEALHQIAKDHILLAKDGVIFTPHIAFYTGEALRRITDKTLENIISFIKNKPVKEGLVC